MKEHNELLSIQFLLGAFKEERPDHRTTEQLLLPGSRQVNPTLLAKFGDRLLDHIDPEGPGRAGIQGGPCPNPSRPGSEGSLLLHLTNLANCVG